MHLWSKAESAQAFKYNQSINAQHIQRRRNRSTYWTFCCTSLSWHPHSRSLHLWLLILHNSQTKKKKHTWKITLIYRNKNRKFLKCVILEPQHQITCHVNLAFTDQKSVSVNSWVMNILNKQNKKAASYL